MTDDDAQSSVRGPANSPLHGIRGFLTAYYVYILIAAGLCLVEILGLSRHAYFWFLTVLGKFVFYVFAAKSLKRIGTPWVRNLHVALNAALTIAVAAAIALNYATVFPVVLLVPWSLANPFLLIGTYFELALSVLSIAVPLAWTVYWLKSKRVHNTYAASSTRDDESAVSADDLSAANRSSKKAWLIATQIAGLLVILYWLSSFPYALRNVLGERGVNPMAAMVAAYPLWFLVLAVFSWGWFKIGKLRIAALTSVIPIALVIAFVNMLGAIDDTSQMVQMNSSYEYMRRLSEVTEEQLLEEQRNQRPEGPFVLYYSSGAKREEGGYDGDGRRHGLITIWQEDGKKLWEGDVVNGVLHGIERKCEEGVLVAERGVLDGKSHGHWKAWYANGQLESDSVWAAGYESGIASRWYEDGQKASESNYVDGIQTGVMTLWHRNGQKSYEATYVNGSSEGVATHWHENGQKESESNYINGGQPDGVWTKWDVNGQVISEDKYVNGVKQY
jgi:antitoxin component YwqK of YwqJK toxin-antitoxin module